MKNKKNTQTFDVKKLEVKNLNIKKKMSKWNDYFLLQILIILLLLIYYYIFN